MSFLLFFSELFAKCDVQLQSFVQQGPDTRGDTMGYQIFTMPNFKFISQTKMDVFLDCFILKY